MYFQYDMNGAPLGFIWNGTQYFYLTNQMGDVIAIVDTQGYALVEYGYDEWGTLTSLFTPDDSEEEIALANINPIRYRGYYFDNETGYYYLQSRYYDASICRFINEDIPEIAQQTIDDINGLNLYSYCCNNPVNNIDYEGYKYSPSKAQAYAKKWWNGTNLDYGRNPSGDCANFVSQCLLAGGLSKMTGAFKWGWHCYLNKNVNVNGLPYYTYDRSHAWAGAHNLYKWLISSHYVIKTFSSTKKSIVDEAGKFIYTYRSKQHCVAVIFFDWTNDGKIDHAALSGEVTRCSYNKNLYNIYYYAHSSDRNGVCMTYLDEYNKKYYASVKDAFVKNKKMKIYILLLI